MLSPPHPKPMTAKANGENLRILFIDGGVDATEETVAYYPEASYTESEQPYGRKDGKASPSHSDCVASSPRPFSGMMISLRFTDVPPRIRRKIASILLGAL